MPTDNIYISLHLADFLIKRKTDTYGTLRINRQGVPTDLQRKKREITAFQRGKVMLLRWKDKKDVCLLSTVHNPIMKATNKKDRDGNVIKQPKVEIDYNDTMGAVDRLDQRLHDYPIARKKGKKYYKKKYFCTYLT